MMLKADLHLHSTASDGTMRPAEVVRLSAQKGCTHIALTDHDSISGIEEAQKEAEKAGLVLIPGIEMSCGGDKEIHVLGYGFDRNNEAVKAFCRSKGEERRSRVARMAGQLKENGVSVSLDRVMELARGVPGRAHMARVLVEEGYASSVRNAFDRYLAQGRCGFVPKKLFAVEQAAGLMAQREVSQYWHTPCSSKRVLQCLNRSFLLGRRAVCAVWKSIIRAQMQVICLHCWASRTGVVCS